jgi:hypothetical protein
MSSISSSLAAVAVVQLELVVGLAVLVLADTVHR